MQPDRLVFLAGPEPQVLEALRASLAGQVHKVEMDSPVRKAPGDSRDHRVLRDSQVITFPNKCKTLIEKSVVLFHLKPSEKQMRAHPEIADKNVW